MFPGSAGHFISELEAHELFFYRAPGNLLQGHLAPPSLPTSSISYSGRTGQACVFPAHLPASHLHLPRAEQEDTDVILTSTQCAISLELSDTHHVVIPSSNINLPQLLAHTCRGSCYRKDRESSGRLQSTQVQGCGGIRGTVSRGGEGLMLE